MSDAPKRERVTVGANRVSLRPREEASKIRSLKREANLLDALAVGLRGHSSWALTRDSKKFGNPAPFSDDFKEILIGFGHELQRMEQLCTAAANARRAAVQELVDYGTDEE